MKFQYKNTSGKDVWIGDVFFKNEATVERNSPHPSLDQAVENGILTVTVTGKIEIPKGGFTVLFDRMGHGKVPQPVRNLEKGATISDLPTLEEEGFTFSGWFSDRKLTQSFTEATPVNENLTLYAKWAEGDAPEPEKVATPIASPAAGEVTSGQKVSLSCSTDDAEIFYTEDGGVPSRGSTPYSAEITINEAKTIKAIAVKAGMTDSDILESSYTIQEPMQTVATPTASPVSGAVTSGQEVTLSCETGGAKIYYTTDGGEPSEGSNLYSAPIPVTEAVTIKAIATKEGMNPSAVLESAYTISE